MAKIIWLTGLSGSGKTTIAKALMEDLSSKGIIIYNIDGDVMRSMFPALGFTKHDRERNLKRAASLIRLLAPYYDCIIASFISPYKKIRQTIKNIIIEDKPSDQFLTAYVKCSLAGCEKRDPKGLYKKARAGEIKRFTGISDPYEKPVKPDLVLDTEALTVEKCVKKIIKEMKL